ncbi:unnamed protein product [Chrysodeixis includens]|uniref:Uncharacterized protein n=1 Tax=Chrysodeixis includens TaxID=689277 RepID=A0A9N8L3E1_CHRIL|nr:unnamed protein product [Chrysodeixis includens]
MLLSRRLAKNKGAIVIAKSDRINALRKQYDAFLEEDQKRKKRNEYILGKLDKMRTTTALVPVRHKVENRSPEVHDVVYHPDISLSHNYKSSITTRNSMLPDIGTGEQYLIQEISKKYILIPKLRSSFNDNGVQPVILNQGPDRHLPVQSIPVKDVKANTDESADWKSKYDILNILKNEEKAPIKLSTGVESEFQSNKEILLSNTHREPTNDHSTINTDEEVTPQTTFFNELPEKDISKHMVTYDSNFHIEDNGIEISSPNSISDRTTYDDNNAVVISDPKDNIDYNLEQLKIDNTNADETNFIVTCSPVTQKDNYGPQPEIKSNVTSTEQGYPPIEPTIDTSTENADIESGISLENNPEMYVNISQDQDPKDTIQTVDLDKITTSAIDITEMQPEIKQSSQEEGTINPEAGDNQYNPPYLEEQTVTISNDLDQMDVQNEQIIPVAIDDKHLNDISGAIDDFNAEQADMFYSEPTDTNVTYTQDTEIAEEQQHEEFDYYKATEEQALNSYATEINEDIEGSVKYDPVYEQQYLNVSQELEQTQQYADEAAYQEQQQYEQQLYEQQQYEQQSEPQSHFQQYEQEYDQQNLEQTLDTEEGYPYHAQQEEQSVVQYAEEAPAPVAQPNLTDNVEITGVATDPVKG